MLAQLGMQHHSQSNLHSRLVNTWDFEFRLLFRLVARLLSLTITGGIAGGGGESKSGAAKSSGSARSMDARGLEAVSEASQ